MDEVTFKLIVVGDVGTGKTTLLHHYVHGRYITSAQHTLGVDFCRKSA